MTDNIAGSFRSLYKSEPALFRSPARVNLIGEHVDYNDGFVLPAAINKELYFAIAPNGLDRSRVHSYDLRADAELNLEDLKPAERHWENYITGVLAQFEKAGHHLPNFDLVFGGNIPIGAGVSSSAAVECGLAFALNHIFGIGIAKFQLARMAQKAEHEYAGVMCGIMDQFANLFGKEGHVVKLDCRSLDYEYYTFDLSEYRIILCDTQIKHSLASSEYNTRREECEEGVSILSQEDENVLSLRDVQPSLLEKHRSRLSPTVYKRCSYVVNEIRRVDEACKDLLQGNLIAFGEKMYETHHGLQHDYEVSCPELDFLVDVARTNDAVIGARMMGGGFGGCTINLVKLDHVEAFIADATNAYEKHFNRQLKTYITEIVNGTSLLER